WRVEPAPHIKRITDEIDRHRIVNEKQSCHLPRMARRIPDSQVCPQRPADQNRSIESNLVHHGLRIRQEALQGGAVRGGGFPMVAKIEVHEPILPSEFANDSLPGHLCCPTTVEEQERLPLTGLTDRELHLSVWDLVVFSRCFHALA